MTRTLKALAPLALLFTAMSAMADAAPTATASLADIPEAPRPPSNRDATLELEATWRGHALQARSSAVDGQRTLQLLDARGRELWNYRIPKTALSVVDHLELHAAEIPVRGDVALFEVVVRGRSYGGGAVQYRTVLQADARVRDIETLWSGRQAAHDTGDTLRIEDLDGDGRDEIVLYARTPAVSFCGAEAAPLFPRVWDARSDRFRPVSLKPAIPAGTTTLRATPAPQRQTVSTGIELWGVSSNDARTIDRSYGRAPASLHDGDIETAWTPREPQGGVGAFVTAQVNLAAGVGGFVVEFAPGDASRATRLLVQLEDASYDIHVPADLIRGEVIFPITHNSSCATLQVVEVADGTRAVSLAELYFYSGLDLSEDDAIYEERVFGAYRDASDTIERTRLAQLMRQDDPRIIRGALALLPTLPPAHQPPVVEALMSTDVGRDAIYSELAAGSLSASSVAAVGRSLRRGSTEGIDQLYATLAETKELTTREALLRVLSRTVTHDDALRLLPFLDDSSTAARTDLAFGLGQALFTDIDRLLLTLNTQPAHDLVLLRAVTRIARRQAGRTPADLSAPAIAKLSEAMNNDNGTVARVAHQLVGILGVGSLRDRLVTAFEEDPHSHIRLAALKGLAEYDQYFAEDIGNTFLLLSALESEDPSIRIAAARLLRERTLDELEIDFIIRVLKEEIWSEASRPLLVALTRQGRPDVDQRTADTVANMEPGLMRAVFVAWQSRREPPQLRVLESLYDDARPNEVNLIAWIRVAARVETESGAEALRRRFADEALPVRARASILEALGRQRIETNLPLLREQLKQAGSVDLRRAAARGLAWFELSDSALAALNDALEHERNETVLDSVRAAITTIERAQSTRELLLGP